MPGFLSTRQASPPTRAGESLSVRLADGAPPGAQVTVSGEFDRATAPEFRAAMRSTISRAGGPVSIDMRGVTFCDAAGLRALTDAATLLRTLEGRLTVIGPCPPLALLLELVELGSLIDIVPADNVEPDVAASAGGRHDHK